MSRMLARAHRRLALRSGRLRVQAGMTLLEILIVLAILALVMGLLVGPRIFAMFEEGKEGVARSMAKQLAEQAYTRWRMKPANTGSDKCPTIEDLAPYVDQKPTFKDPWGNPYAVACGGPRPISVSSAGADGKMGTGDDLNSWDD